MPCRLLLPSNWDKFRSLPICPGLYHVYVCGEAYLAAGQGGAAAVELQKILDHGGIA